MDIIKNIFNINKNKYKDIDISEELISIYKKQKNYRTSKDNKKLIEENANLECFQKILNSNEGELKYESIIKNIDFAIYDKGKIIYSPRDLITNMFYIFYGNVNVDKNKIIMSPSTKINKKINLDSIKETKDIYGEENINKGKDNNKNNKSNDIKKLGFFKKLFEALTKKKFEEEKNIYEVDDSMDEISNMILSKGEEYGEGQINLTKRKDLVKTKTTCIIGFLSKHDYKMIFEKTDILKKNDMFNFLKNVKILKGVNNEVVFNNLYKSIKEKQIYRGESLIKYGEDFNNFYIIRKGFFQVNLNVRQKINNIFNDLNYFGTFSFKEKSQNIKYELRNYYLNDETYKIVTYGEGEIVGDIELYLGSDVYLKDIFCNSDSSLIYEIDTKNLKLNSYKTMRGLMIKEGKKKMQYFKKRIYDIKVINSKKLNSKNKFKEIILNKLEEEKGEIFYKMENDNINLKRYEKKRRKKLISTKINNNNNIKNIIKNKIYNKDKEGNNKKFLSFNDEDKLTKDKFKGYDSEKIKDLIKNNYPNKFKSESKEKNYVFSTSVSSKKYKLKINKNNNKKNKIVYFRNNFIENRRPNSNMKNNNFYSKLTKTNEKTISILFNSSKNLKNTHDNINFDQSLKKINNKKYSEKLNTEFLTLKNDSIVSNKIFLNNNNLMPTLPNEQFQSIFNSLFNSRKYKNKSVENNESINNNGNYYNTQDSTVRKTNDCSKITLNSVSPKIIKHPLTDKKNKKMILSSKLNSRFYDERKISLLFEIIQDKKNLLKNRISNSRNKNYNIKSYKYIK